ncbi:MAG TPA: hypothetical protein VNP95_06250, partial [Thermomicrobiales bacterium]|nr:hypothetical protein [Thermomicrobiales bacterium]
MAFVHGMAGGQHPEDWTIRPPDWKLTRIERGTFGEIGTMQIRQKFIDPLFVPIAMFALTGLLIVGIGSTVLA